MVKWEYMSVITCIIDNKHRAKYVNGQQIQGWEKMPPFGETLNELGEEGWEYIYHETNDENWEYMTRFISANKEDDIARKYLEKRYTDVKELPKFLPAAMEPFLNESGSEQWELVHMQPVPGLSKEQLIDFNEGSDLRWSNVYFCVFKHNQPTLLYRFKRQKEQGQTSTEEAFKRAGLLPPKGSNG